MPQQSASNSQSKYSPETGVLRGVSIPELTRRAFPQLFEYQAAQLPDKIAVTCRDQSLTYAELNARANQLARHLQRLGAMRETIVAICLDRSLDLAVGILGVLKSGAAYLPLDPEYPKARLSMMIDDARPAIVLTKASQAIDLPSGIQTVEVDRDWQEISQLSDANCDPITEPGRLAYVIYTSGSTGAPKGVMITHGNLSNYLGALDHELHLTPEDIYLHTASAAFSSSRRQLMLPLSQGACVVIASSEERKDPLALFRLIKESHVTVMDAVPSFWRNCTTILQSIAKKERDELLTNKLRLLLSASEPLPAEVPRIWTTEFKHPAQHVHMFGQTETAGIVCLYRVPSRIPEDAAGIPAGHPIANTEIHILDEEMRPCPIGVAGELYIGGAGVGRGYINQPELTSQKFLPNPYSDQGGARLYRTGDWARIDADGQVRFAGRRDQQIKLRGFRIELGEIEATLAAHPEISECAVVARQSPSGSDGQVVIAYFVDKGRTLTANELRAFLGSHLPEHAIPAAFVRLDALPLTPNGKIDRLGLPAPETTRPELSAAYEPPRDHFEEELCRIWREVLHLDLVGIHDNFFELGGNSLQAAQICARARNTFHSEVPLRLIFDHSTIAAMAAAIHNCPERNDLTSISPRPSHQNSTAPLSFSQEQFWLLHHAQPTPALYNVSTALRFEGALEVDKLRCAFESLVTRHEILRTNFIEREGSPIQVIADSVEFPFTVSDLSGTSPADQERQTENFLQSEASMPFNLEQGALFRARLIRLSDQAHVLGLTIHHIICDGWSVGLLLRELFTLYEDSSANTLPATKIQFADFAVWQRNQIHDKRMNRQLAFWKDKLSPLPPPLALTTDFQRPVPPTFNGAEESVLLDPRLVDSIQKFSRREGVTPFMTTLATFQTLLHRYTGETDIAVGSPVAARTTTDTENLIGPCVNTVVLRANLKADPRLDNFLEQVRDLTLEAFANQDTPFEKLVEELRPVREPNCSPVFQVMFVFQNTPPLNLKLQDLRLSTVRTKRNTAKFDLTLELREEADRWRACLEYNRDLFEAAAMRRLLEHFQNLLNSVVANPRQKISELSLVSDDERTKLLADWNSTSVEFSSNACIHELFERQAATTPDVAAAEFDGSQITYRELNSRANQLANYLVHRGVAPEVRVGICVERSVEMLVSILGVLKAGGAYVPLDPSYPHDRLSFMIDDAQVPLILTQKRFAGDLPQTEADLVFVDADWEKISGESNALPEINVSAENLCYVIYTSGSTGTPKGVMIEHRSLVNFVEAAAAAYRITAGDRILQFASLNFDLSAEEIYPALTRGATVVLRTEEMIDSPQTFLRYCDEWQLTVLDLPTAYWHELVHAARYESLSVPSSVHLVIVGGEKVRPEMLSQWNDLTNGRVQLINSYGPTEATVVVTMADLTEPRSGSRRANVVIGGPIQNTVLYVLADNGQLAPIGVPGELHIGGVCLARGYLNRPELTAEKFIPNPFDKSDGARLYKTGDLVRWREDGNIEFLGRADNQIKIRGFRVELEEIEGAMRAHPAVANAVVDVTEDSSGNKRLIGYFVPSGTSDSSDELRNFLKSKLPSYMRPATLEQIEAIPLTPSGKIDRRSLPKTEPGATTDRFEPPATEIEQLLARAWCEVLNVARVGVHDNFFELGGHSLLAARVVSKVRKELDLEFGMADVLRLPTIAELAGLISERTANVSDDDANLAALVEEVSALSEEEAELRLLKALSQADRDIELLPV